MDSKFVKERLLFFEYERWKIGFWSRTAAFHTIVRPQEKSSITYRERSRLAFFLTVSRILRYVYPFHLLSCSRFVSFRFVETLWMVSRDEKYNYHIRSNVEILYPVWIIIYIYIYHESSCQFLNEVSFLSFPYYYFLN